MVLTNANPTDHDIKIAMSLAQRDYTALTKKTHTNLTREQYLNIIEKLTISWLLRHDASLQLAEDNKDNEDNNEN